MKFRHIRDIDVFLILFLSCLASIGISIWSVYADPIINNDGIDYIRSAQAMLDGGFSEASKYYKWLFYPALVAGFHKVFAIGLENSAHVINAISNMITVVAFILTARLFGAGRFGCVIAAVIIITFPGLNEIRSYIVRDHGYIAFYLTSFYFFARYWITLNRYDYLFSLLFSLVAFLFRIEGLIFALLIFVLPIYESIRHKRSLRWLVYLNFVLCIVSLMGIYGMWLYAPTHEHSYSKFSLQAIFIGWEQLIENLLIRVELLKLEVLNTASDSTGRSVYLWTAVGVIVTHMVSLLTLLYTIFFIYSLRKKLLFPQKNVVNIWTIFVVANFIILMLFTLTQLFLTDRYPLPISVTVLIAVVFAINHWFVLWVKSKKNVESRFYKYLGYIVLLLLFANGYEGLTSYSKKRELVSIGNWLEDNLEPNYDLYKNNKILFTNSKLLGYFSEIPADQIRNYSKESEYLHFFYQGKWVDFQYIVLDVKMTDEMKEHLAKAFWAEPIKVFEMKGDREIRVYDIYDYRQKRKAGLIR